MQPPQKAARLIRGYVLYLKCESYFNSMYWVLLDGQGIAGASICPM